jgi:hypothetical protein
MKPIRRAWTLQRVRRTWAQGRVGKAMAVLLGVAMLMPSFAAVPPWVASAHGGGCK